MTESMFTIVLALYGLANIAGIIHWYGWLKHPTLANGPNLLMTLLIFLTPLSWTPYLLSSGISGWLLVGLIGICLFHSLIHHLAWRKFRQLKAGL